MYEVPIKWVFRGGERQAAAVHMRQGQALMRMLENHMSYRNLQQGVLRRFVRPDVLIECDKRFGLRTVTITTVPVVIGTTEQIEQGVFNLLVAVSDSTGMHLYGAERWEKDFVYETPLYGHYEAIPSSYNFESDYRATWKTWTFPATNTDVLTRAVDASVDGVGVSRQLALSSRIWLLEDHDEEIYGWYGLGSDTGAISPSPTGCKWPEPVLMPWKGKKIITAFVVLYGGENVGADALPSQYQPSDAMYLSDIGLGPYDAQGWAHGRSVAWTRGVSTNSYGDIGPIVPLPEHNGVRRFVILRFGGEAFFECWEDPVLFRLTSIRGENDVRDISFKAGALLAELCPEWLHDFLYANGPRKHYFHTLGNWAHADEITGEVIVHLVLSFGSDGGMFEYGEYEYDPSEEPAKYAQLERRKWGMCMFRVVVPAAVFDMSKEDEEETILRDVRVENLVTAEQFLPLLDMLFWSNRSKLIGGGDFLSISAFLDPEPQEHHRSMHILYAEEPDEGGGRRFLNYTVGETTYNYGAVPYNLMNGEIHVIWSHAHSLCLHMFSQKRLGEQKALFAHGDTAYVWTRHFGGIALTPVGMVPQEMVWPEIITQDTRTRPNVTYAGNSLWCCVCERAGEQVMGVFVGSPVPMGDDREAEWTEVVLVTEEWAMLAGNRIVHVRPLRATPERVVLLAIVRTVDDEGEAHHKLAVCDGTPGTNSTLLKFRGEIPLEQEDEGMSWDICIPNEHDEYARMMTSYPTPPTAYQASVFHKTDAQYWVAVDTRYP